MQGLLLVSMAAMCVAQPVTSDGFSIVSESMKFLAQRPTLHDGDYVGLEAAGVAGMSSYNSSGSSPGFDEATTRERVYEAYASYCSAEGLQAWDCYWCKKTLTKYTFVAAPDDKKKNARAYIAFAPGRVLVAFRGTQALSLENWIEDMEAMPLVPFGIDSAPPRAKVHPGFRDAYRSIQSQVLSGVVKACQLCSSESQGPQGVCTGCEVIVTGHSLGAAEAVHAALDFKMILGINPVVTTFGLPRVGNRIFAEYWGSKIETSAEYTHWRIVNNRDPVPSYPAELLGYKHVGHEVWVRPHYTLCGAPSFECGVPPLVNPLDHLSYMGVQLLNLTDGCEAR